MAPSRTRKQHPKKKPLSPQQKGWVTRRRAQAARSARAIKGWETRRFKVRSQRATKGWETRRKHESDARKKAQAERKTERVSIVLYDGHADDPPNEVFWSNITDVEGKRIDRILTSIPAEDGDVIVTFTLEDKDTVSAEREDDTDEHSVFGQGEQIEVNWDSELEPRAFWETYFDHARTLLPKAMTQDKGAEPGIEKSDPNKALLVVKIVVLYAPSHL